MGDGNEIIEPFEPFIILYKILGWAGYYKLIDKPKNKCLIYLHHVYRFFVFLFVIYYNLQHILFFVKVFEIDKELAIEALMFVIPHWNLFTKILAVNKGTAKLDELQRLMTDLMFAAKNKQAKKFLRKNRDTFHRLTKTVMILTSISNGFWILVAIFNKMANQNAVVPIYVPFSTDSWIGYGFAMLLEHGPMFWVAQAHLTFDILIGCHYSQATVQLKIIRYDLEHLCDSDKVPGYAGFKNQKTYKYLDELDESFKKRFDHIVQKYAQVIWFVNETTAVFGSAITVQFFSTSSAICLVTYKLSLASPGSVEFMFLALFFFLLQVQVVMYCFFGELLKDESNHVVNSAYLSGWLSLSPRARRKLLIAMTRWTAPIIPLVAGVVPLSLNTFIHLIRLAFNLFTVLKATK